jgi:hypothetical protein
MANLFDPQETYDNTYQGQRDRRYDHNAAMGILGANTAPQTQNVGGWAVAPSATSQLANALKQYSAMKKYNNTLPPTTPAAPAAPGTDSIGQTIAKQAADALLKQQQAQQQSNTIGMGEY